VDSSSAQCCVVNRPIGAQHCSSMWSTNAGKKVRGTASQVFAAEHPILGKSMMSNKELTFDNACLHSLFHSVLGAVNKGKKCSLYISPSSRS